MKLRTYANLGIGLGTVISFPLAKKLLNKIKGSIKQKDKANKTYQQNDNVNLFI